MDFHVTFEQRSVLSNVRLRRVDVHSRLVTTTEAVTTSVPHDHGLQTTLGHSLHVQQDSTVTATVTADPIRRSIPRHTTEVAVFNRVVDELTSEDEDEDAAEAHLRVPRQWSWML